MASNPPKITANQIKDMLAAKHAKDVFVAECKNGPTWNASGLGILDAWAMKKSWANACTWGYEIKVSRSDFLRDDKWQGYLPYCNQFSFVCPNGLIQLDEVPAEAGLIVVSKTGRRLFTKKKAPHRPGEPPWEIAAYILMSRAKIDAEHAPYDRRAYWTNWLKQKKVDSDLGYQVSRALRETIQKRIVAAEDRARQQAKDIERLSKVQDVIKELGLYKWADSRAVRERAENIAQAIPPDLMRTLAAAERAVINCQDSLKKHVLEVSDVR